MTLPILTPETAARFVCARCATTLITVRAAHARLLHKHQMLVRGVEFLCGRCAAQESPTSPLPFAPECFRSLLGEPERTDDGVQYAVLLPPRPKQAS
jgi:hypothetical protein